MVQTVPKFDVILSLTVPVATIIMNAVGVAMGGTANPVCPRVVATYLILSNVPNANMITIVSMALVIVEIARVSQDTDSITAVRLLIVLESLFLPDRSPSPLMFVVFVEETVLNVLVAMGFLLESSTMHVVSVVETVPNVSIHAQEPIVARVPPHTIVAGV